MRGIACVLTIAACGSPDLTPASSTAEPALAPATTSTPTPTSTSTPTPPTQVAAACGEWRFAVVAGAFEVVETVSLSQLANRWVSGSIAASPETETALAALLGARTAVTMSDRPTFDAEHWGIVPVHELSPAWNVIRVDGKHPFEGETSPLVARVCGTTPTTNFDRAKLTTLVMSGTTALTGRTSEQIDDRGIAHTIEHIEPFFRSADFGHVSNEVAFVKKCKPWKGQAAHELKFCSRDRYIDLLAALHVTIIELTGSHLLDYGHRSLERTIDMYEQRGWIWFGGGRTQIEATAPRIIEHHGNRLAFLGCNRVNWWNDQIFTGSGGANCDYARMAWQISDLRRRGHTVIVSVQHRELATHRPAFDLVGDLRKLASSGAAFVQGSQAHTAHPWDVHHGAFVHYGLGNMLFAQHRENQRDAVVDKLYIHEGRLLTVEKLLIRSERGRPRPMTAAERERFMAQMTAATAGIAAADPWAPVALIPETRERPDSLVARGKSQKIAITLPVGFTPGKKYPLVVALDKTTVDDAAFVVRRTADINGKWLVATPQEIASFMTTKYSPEVDPDNVRVTGEPAPPTVVAIRTRERSSGRPMVRITKAVNGLRWVRHKHRHELDYQIDADGRRVDKR